MKIAHAIRVAEQLRLDADQYSTVMIGPDQKIALTVLTRLAKRVVAARQPLKQLARAVDGGEDLNQDELFGEKEE